jgi:hypothetical protein
VTKEGLVFEDLLAMLDIAEEEVAKADEPAGEEPTKEEP